MKFPQKRQNIVYMTSTFWYKINQEFCLLTPEKEKVSPVFLMQYKLMHLNPEFLLAFNIIFSDFGNDFHPKMT